jgi:hypothetical protein
MKNYFINEDDFSLEQVALRIKHTDLTPGIEPIRLDIDKIVAIIKRTGIDNLAGLRNALRNKKKMHDFSLLTGIDEKYIVLLRREIEGWIIKSIKIRDFYWLDGELITTLHEIGLCSTDEIYYRLSIEDEQLEIARNHQLSPEDLCYILTLSTITRIRWVSPVVARILIESGYNTIEKIKEANPGKLCIEIEQLNSSRNYYKGKIGERDIRRMIHEAGYVK